VIVHWQGATQYLQKKECCAGGLQGRLLKMLVGATRAKTVLEIGMFTGTSTLAMAEALPDDGKVGEGGWGVGGGGEIFMMERWERGGWVQKVGQRGEGGGNNS
jgi:hypothetical protein